MNKNFIGKEVTAAIGVGNDWIKYSDGNNGEPNYFRDYYEPETDMCCYMQGETCKIEGFNNEKETVLLSNINYEKEYCLEVFEISYKQFKSDFGRVKCI